MSEWTKEQLGKIAETDDLHIAPFRGDGKTYGTLTWIWSVVVDGHLYVRAYNGTGSRWYRAAIAQRTGRIRAAGMTCEVSFAAAPEPMTAAIDAAYKAKYSSSPYLKPMVGSQAQAATIVIRPR